MGAAALAAVLLPSAHAQLNISGSWPALPPAGFVRELGVSPVSLPDLPPLVTPVVVPRMSAELALQTYEARSYVQGSRLLTYSDQTVMVASLPDTKQRGEYELTRQYSAPNSLRFTPLRFEGDNFVKSNVLVRLLQSEVDHVTRQQGPETAISSQNYKFSPKAVENVDNRFCYVFQVKPRKKRVGLFKGKIYIDAYTGALVRAEGQMVKSPSIFIKKLSFVQDYVDVDGFMLPVHLHSEAKVRIIGRAVVDVFHRGYKATAAAVAQSGSTLVSSSDSAKVQGSE